MASIATTAPIRCSVIDRVMSRSSAGSMCTIDSSRIRSGHRIITMTVPSAISLNRPLAKLAAACLPNRRLKPEAGEILDSFGLSGSPENTSLCWIMLPAMAANASSASGRPMAPISMYSRLFASPSSPAPSTGSIQDFAIRLRSGSMMLVPIEPEKVDIASVAAAITNQVLSSWLLTTSPFSTAWSRRFCVGSSVLSDVSLSSAIDRPSLQRQHLVHDAAEILQEGSHHRRQHQGEDQEACENRERHADEIDLHLRHQPRQHAEPEVEDEAEHQKRRGELQAELEGGGKGAGGERGDIAGRNRLAGREDLVAVVEGGDEEVVAVGRKQ